jgi:hypothetical protein
MAFASGTVDVGEDAAVALCGVPPSGVRVRNLGDVTVYLGDSDVGEGSYPLDGGHSDTFPGSTPKESPLVPAPDDDLAAPVLYARTGKGTGSSKVSYIA